MTLLIPIAFLLGRQSQSVTSTHNDSFKSNISNMTSESTPSFMNDNTNINSTSKQSNSASSVPDTNMQVGRVYASSKGKKYYIEGLCDGNISVKNKVYYKDESSAERSGKSKAAGCQ